MGKVLAILVAGLASAAGAGYAFFHFADPYRCDLATCDTAPRACCVEPTAAAPESPAATADAHDCCAALTQPVSVVAPCCGTTACPAPAGDRPALAAAVGPAAAR